MSTLLVLFQLFHADPAALAREGVYQRGTPVGRVLLDGEGSSDQVSADGTQAGEAIRALPKDWTRGRITDGPGRPVAETVVADLVGQLGERRASMYDRGDHFEIRVVAPTDADIERVIAAQALSPISLDLVAFESSDSWQQDLALQLSEMFSDVGLLAGVDLEAGRVYVGTADGALSDETIEALTNEVSRAIGQGKVTGEVSRSASVDEVFEVVSSKIQNRLVEVRDNPPLKGGRWVNMPTFGCTAGFMVMSKTSGAIRFTTAGHCFRSDQTEVRMVDGSYVGSRTQWRPAGWDIANFSLPAAWQEQAAVTVRGNGAYRPVVGSGNPAHGTQYCFTGRGIVSDGYDEKCGNQNKTIVDNGKTLYCLERESLGGDSGGPVYYVNGSGEALARGTMVAAHHVDNPWPWTDTSHACYNRINDVASAGNWSVVLWK